MFRGDVIRHEWAGGGGWGDPLERDPAQVLRDVRNEYVSAGSARDDYGVVVDPATWTVDEAATGALRASLRSGRAAASPPPVAWTDDWTGDGAPKPAAEAAD